MATITQATNLYNTLKATATPANAPDAAALTRIVGELFAAIAAYNGVANGTPGALPGYVGGTQFYGPWLLAYTTAFSQADAAARQMIGTVSGTTPTALTFDTTTPTFNLLMARLANAISFVPTTSPALLQSLNAYRSNVVALMSGGVPNASDPVYLAFQGTAQAQITAAYLDAGGWATDQGISYS